MTVSTKGDHCAGIATDRGGGSISCADSSIATAGSGSVTVTVETDYGTTVEAGSETELKGSDSMIDRSAYDEASGTESSWTM